MKTKEILLVLIILFITFASTLYGQTKGENPIKWSAGILTGYNRGFGIKTNLTARNFDKGFPFELRFGLGFNILNPGNAADARRIFINNATNGVPEKNGRSFDYRLDLLMPKTIFNVNHSYLAFGPRFSTFRGEFKYVGGNEDFEVTSNQWGLGGEIENHFKMIKNIELVMAFGIDFYLPGTLSGHDTSYSPDNDNINPSNDNQNDNRPFKYRDADKAINQPKFMPHVMLGVNFNL
jgi:hypothetical protein